MAEDDELLSSINEGDVSEGSDDTSGEIGGDTKPKTKKEKQEKVAVKQSNQTDKLDPREEFISILSDIGIKRGVGVITDVFFNGEISDPEYLDKCLSLGGIAVPQRRLIITRYFGQSPEDLGVEMITTAQSRKGGKGQGQNDVGEDIGVTATKMMKDRLQAAQTKALINQLEGYDDDSKKELPQKTIERPLIDADTGEFIVKDGKPVMERITTIGGESATSSDPMTTMLAMANILGKKGDSNDRPQWAVELQNQVVTSNDKRRLEDDLRRERDKREDEEKEHRREMERMKDDMAREISHIKDGHIDEMKRISDEMTFRITNVKDNFEAEVRHRDEMDGIKEIYGGEFGKLRDEIDMMNKDVKSAVVGEAVKTGSKVVGKSTDTLDTVIGGAADVLKDMYKAQISTMRGNVQNAGMPNTTEDELKELL
jgi:hypothetical protein